MDTMKWHRLSNATANAASWEQTINNLRRQDSLKVGDTAALRNIMKTGNLLSSNHFCNDIFDCMPLTANGETRRHEGLYPNSWIKGDTLSLGCLPTAMPLTGEDGRDTSFSPDENPADGGGMRSGSGTSFNTKATDKVSHTLGASASAGYWRIGANSGFSRTKTVRDFMDLNGDGVADVIHNSDVFYSRPFPATMDVTARQPMSGFSAHSSTNNTGNTDAMARATEPVQVTVMSGKGHFYVKESVGSNAGTSTDCTEHTLADINGDGLPDMVYRNGTVRLNTGYGFSQGRIWNNLDEIGVAVSAASGSGENFSVWSDAVSAGLGTTHADNISPVFLCDINGDGMPDMVYKNTNGSVEYRPNNGNGFGGLTPWREKPVSEKIETGVSLTVSGDAGITGGFILFGLKCGVSAGVHGSVGMNNERMRILDFNGDGMPDLLTSFSKGKLHVRYAEPGRTGLLKTVTNPLGGSVTMDYKLTQANVYHSRRWVMTKVMTHDSLPDDGCDSLCLRIRYDHGWYDRTEREFLGFAVVVSEPVDGNGTALRTTIRYYDNRSVHAKGSPLCEALVRIQGTDTAKYVVTTYSYTMDSVGERMGGIKAVFPKLVRRQTCYYEGLPQARITAWETYVYENTFGNVTQRRQGSTDQPTVKANISYHAQYNSNRCVNRVASVEITDANMTVYRKRTTEVDNKGHYTAFRDWYDNTHYLSTALQYDQYGNVTTMRGSNTTVHYTYDNYVHTYPTSITDTFGVTSELKDYDFRFGIPRTIVDQAGSRMEYTLDEWGRTVTIRGPKEIAAGKPFTIRYTYAGREAAPTGSTRQRAVSMAMTENYDPEHPQNPIKTYTYCDGLGRIVQTRKEAEIGGVEKLVVSGHTVVDALGRTVETYYPTEKSLTDVLFAFDPDQSASASTVTYDILDRPLVQTAPDASTTTFSYGFNGSHLNKMLFSSTTTDANSHVSTELKDVEGKPWAVQAAGRQFVYFNYNPVGDNTKVYSAVANDWERNYTYDMLGRRLTYQEGELVESLTYNGGNLATHSQSWLENGTTQTKTTTYHYNAHRLDSVSYEDALTTIYHYDQYGRVDSLYDESGVVCYQYGNMGEVTQETRIYALPFLSSPLALSTQFTYDSWGRIQDITYPDNEVVSYTYDLGGQLQSISNNNNYTYLDNVAYDRFGAKVSQAYGNGMVTDYNYHNLTRRLASINVSDGTSIAYTYDPVGNVTQVANSYSWMQGQNLTETYTYDASDQLVSASETQAQNYQLAVTYGNWGKINSYALAQTDCFNGTTTQCSRSFTYPSDPNSPQESQSMFAPESYQDQQAQEDVCFTFGINGSLRKREVQGADPHTEHYLFNSASNLKAYGSDAMDFAYYGYNAANTRTYKLCLSGTIQWQNGQQLQMNLQPHLAQFYPNAYINFNGNGEYTKHYYNGTERIASRLGNANTDITVTANARLTSRSTQLASRFQDDIWDLMSDNSTVCPPSGISVNSLHQTGNATDIFYYHTNHLGSTAYVTDQNQNVSQGFLYAPFGEITTEYNANFGNNVLPKYSFNAKELDEETSMYYYEARYYKPPVFTSRDPMFEKYFWMTPYAYCANNPVKYVDPSGNFYIKTPSKNYNRYRAMVTNYKWVNTVSAMTLIPYLGICYEGALAVQRFKDPSFNATLMDYVGFGFQLYGMGSMKLLKKMGKIDGLGEFLLKANRKGTSSLLTAFSNPETSEIALEYMAIRALEKDGMGVVISNSMNNVQEYTFLFDEYVIKQIKKSILSNKKLTSKKDFDLEKRNNKKIGSYDK